MRSGRTAIPCFRAVPAASNGCRKWTVSCVFTTLPTWQRRDVDVLLKRLNGTERNRAFVEGFLSAPFEKALARVSQDNYMFGGWGFKSIGDARNRALDGCGKQRPPERCAIVMENNNWVGNSH